MARNKEDIVYFSIRLRLSNPQHMKIAKSLKKIDSDPEITKNQYMIDALEYYIDFCEKEALNEQKEKYITERELDELEKRLKSELAGMISTEMMKHQQPISMTQPFWVPQMPIQPIQMQQVKSQKIQRGEEIQFSKESQIDDVISGLVAEWD